MVFEFQAEPGAGRQRGPELVILSQAGTSTWDWGAFVLVAGCWKPHFCISQGFLVVSDRKAQLSTFKSILAFATEWSGAEGAACVGWSRSSGSISLSPSLLLSLALFPHALSPLYSHGVGSRLSLLLVRRNLQQLQP